MKASGSYVSIQQDDLAVNKSHSPVITGHSIFKTYNADQFFSQLVAHYYCQKQ